MSLSPTLTIGGALLVVVVGVGFATTLGREPPTSPARFAAGRSVTTPPPRTTAPPFTSETATAPARPSATPTTTRTTPARRTVAARPRAPVVVLNNTRIDGLAAQTAQHLEQLGWHVRATGNFQGLIPRDTVYFPAGLRRQARRLAKVLDNPRVLPALSWMRPRTLTVILADTAAHLG